MSVAYYIALNSEVDFDSFVSGKAIAQAADELTLLCDEHELKPMDAFLNQSLSGIMGDLGLPDFAAPEADFPEQGQSDAEDQWFDPDEGIEWVNALMALVSEEGDLQDEDAVLEELEEYLYVLISAKKANIKWRFELDG